MTKKIIIPKKLKPGEKIGIAAPAGHFDVEIFNNGLGVLKSMGYEVVTPMGVFKKHGRFAGTDSHRATALNRLFADPQISGIICARGGYGSMRMLSSLDFINIQKNPKLVMGFSDITALLVTLYNECRMMTYHGPNITTLADADELTRKYLTQALSSGTSEQIKAEDGVTIKSGKAVGPFIAGNLRTLCHLIGTPFEPDLYGHILLIEDVGEEPYRIDRMLTHMKLAGCFNGLVGLAMGSFENCGSIDRIHSIVEDIFNDVEFPIISGFHVGHGKINMAIPVGIEAILDTDHREILFHESSHDGK